jgi:mono/diheme cytochrome c family protein
MEMWNAHHKIGVCLRSATVVASIVLAQATLAAGSEATAQAANPVNERYHVDVTKLFATHCSWCHDAYGMQPGKGPKLAGTSKSKEQVVEQISNGKPGYMPAFKSVLKDEQIQAMAEYVKALPAN